MVRSDRTRGSIRSEDGSTNPGSTKAIQERQAGRQTSRPPARRNLGHPQTSLWLRRDGATSDANPYFRKYFVPRFAPVVFSFFAARSSATGRLSSPVSVFIARPISSSL